MAHLLLLLIPTEALPSCKALKKRESGCKLFRPVLGDRPEEGDNARRPVRGVVATLFLKFERF